MTSLIDALAKAQGEMTNATLNKTNPHFKSKYADLAEIIDTVRAPLAKHGISFVHRTDIVGDQLVCYCELRKGDDVINSLYPVGHVTTKAQQLGSALTYAKRYTLSSICGIAADEDDDGNEAQKAELPKPKQINPNKPVEDWLGVFNAKLAKCKDVNQLMLDEQKSIAKLEANYPDMYQDLLKSINQRQEELNA